MSKLSVFSPYIIGTMTQTGSTVGSLQLHHNFRWVLCPSHLEPVRGFLGRFLQRRLIEEEVASGMRNPELARIAAWLPKVWQNLNKFLETYSSSDVTIGENDFKHISKELFKVHFNGIFLLFRARDNVGICLRT